MRLQGKLLMFTTPLLLTPVVITAWIAYHLLLNQAMERTRQMALGQLSSELARFDQMRSNAESSLRVLAGTPLVQRYLLTDDEAARYALMQPALFRLFNNYQHIYPHYDEMRILLPDGFEDTRSTIRDWQNQTEEEMNPPFFSGWQSLEAEEVASDLLFHPDNRELALILGIKVVLRNRAVESVGSKPRLRGYIGITIGLQHFNELLHKRSIGNHGRMLVVDAAGREQFVDDGFHGLALQNFAAQDNPGEALRVAVSDGDPILDYWSRPLGNGYHLVAILPQSEIYSASRSLATSVVIITLIAMALLFTGMYLVLQHLVIARLALLGQATESIADGRNPVLEVPASSDQIGLLFHAFKDMQARLLSSRDTLESYQAELEDKVEKVQAADQAKSAFLAKMSHEIRTPMNGVIGMAELLQQTPLSQQQSRYLTIIQKSSNNLLDIINDILDFSKIESGKLELRKEPMDLVNLFEEVQQLFEQAVAVKGLRLSLTLEPDLPKRLIGDEQRLRQVLINLIGNAIKFTAQGWIDVKVTKESQQEETVQVRVRVSDSGIGLSHEEQEKIFESFRQADDSSSRRYGGTGLGLSIARQLIHLMGGEIGVQSAPGEGAVFWFTVPLKRLPRVDITPQAERSDELTANSESAMPSEGMGLKILLVEDNQVNQVLTEEMLLDMGCEIVLAENGEEALSRAHAEHFDIILMDCQMPVLDGYKATRQLREYETEQGLGRTPVIAVTANAYETDRQNALAAGMDDVLTKPFTSEALYGLLVKWRAADSRRAVDMR